jgi:hypothetical protein
MGISILYFSKIQYSVLDKVPNTTNKKGLAVKILTMFIASAVCYICQLQSTQTPQYNWIFIKFNLLKPTGYVMHHQFNIQQFYILPTLYLCVLYLSVNKQRLVPLRA